MNTATAKRDLLESCKNPKYREALTFENVYTGICSQIRVLREQHNLSQAMFGREAKMAQERISILEDPNANTKPTLNTLLRIAAAFDVGLDVRFVPFSTVLDRSVNTDSADLEVPSFDEEKAAIEAGIAREEAAARPGKIGTLQQFLMGNVGESTETNSLANALEGFATLKELGDPSGWRPLTRAASFINPGNANQGSDLQGDSDRYNRLRLVPSKPSLSAFNPAEPTPEKAA